MTTRSVDVLVNIQGKEGVLCLDHNRRTLRKLWCKPFCEHRAMLGRAWFTPDDVSRVQEIALEECAKAGIRIDSLTLYIEANKLSSEIARRMFPNSC